ncbi:MAG: hypothetical protein KatS3mg102_1398 [Planctomycetota bacterium]|nr:MAG: hypothetical protein KatS3mg102_1398 [Planctomycetota bacterium]
MQTDVKSAIAYATLCQVGIIVVEIALGLELLAMLHLAGHVLFRLLQFLSAPNVLHDLHELHNRLGSLPHASADRSLPGWRRHLYLFALERGFADALLERVVVAPLLFLARRLDVLDRWLVGAPGGRRRDP